MSEAEESKTAQILVRIAEDERDEWKQAAEKLGVSMSDLIRSSVAPIVLEALHCSHPGEYRRAYPWAEFCDKCGDRLRG
jgi:16S rRNA U516 pseudouridylate synthase RsuA-like enzyme